MRQRVPIGAMRIDRPRAEARACVAFALLYVVASFATGLVIRAHPVPILGAAGFTQDLWYVSVFKLTLLLTLPLVALRSAGYGAADLLQGWPGLRGVPTAILAFAAGAAVNLGHLVPIRQAAARFSRAELAVRLGAGVVLPLVAAGLPEEVVYRGLLQTRLEAVRGRLFAILVAVALFTAWHLPTRFLLSHGSEGEAGDALSVLLQTGLPVFVVGLTLAVAWDRWRNLPALVAFHWGVDLLPTIRSLLGDRF